MWFIKICGNWFLLIYRKSVFQGYVKMLLLIYWKWVMFTMKSTKIDFIKHDILQSTSTFSVKYNALSNAWRNTLISLTNGNEAKDKRLTIASHVIYHLRVHHRISSYIIEFQDTFLVIFLLNKFMFLNKSRYTNSFLLWWNFKWF